MLEARVHSLAWERVSNQNIVALANEKRELGRVGRSSPEIEQKNDCQSEAYPEFIRGTTHKYIISNWGIKQKFILEYN